MKSKGSLGKLTLGSSLIVLLVLFQNCGEAFVTHYPDSKALSLGSELTVEGAGNQLIDGIKNRNLALDPINGDMSLLYAISDTLNTSFDCVRDGALCETPSNFGDFNTYHNVRRIYDNEGNLVFDSENTNMGFTANGQACALYDSVEGSDLCPFRPVIKWRPECIEGCVDPDIYLEIRMDYNPKTKEDPAPRFNRQIVILRNALLNLVASCEDLGGTFGNSECNISKSKTCSINNGEGLSSIISGAFGECMVASCNDDYSKDANNNSCVEKFQSQSVANGSMTQIWDGTKYINHNLNCNSGYMPNGNGTACVQAILPFHSVITHSNADSAFGCAGSGWRNLKVVANGTSLTISATNLRADYRWKGSGASANAYSGISYAYGRDNTQLRINSSTGHLEGRCKGHTGYYRLKTNPLCAGKGTFTTSGCRVN